MDETSLQRFCRLTPREREVATLVAEGLSNPEIAKRLGCASGTVKVHVGHIFEKIQVESRLQLALFISDNK